MGSGGMSASGSVADVFDLGFSAVALAFDEFRDEVIVYPEFGSQLRIYDRAGNEVRTISVPWSSNDIDMDVAHTPVTIGAVTVPAGSLIVADGDAGGLLRAYDLSSGSAVQIAEVTMSGQFSTVGLAVAPDGASVYNLSWTSDTVGVVDPATGVVGSSFPVMPSGSPSFSIFYGDIEADVDSGDLYLVSSDQALIRHLRSNGAFVRDVLLTNALVNMAGIAIDNTRREFWVSTVGSGQLFRIVNLLNCPAELTGDGQVDSGDLSAFINAFLVGDFVADANCDGEVDSGDLAIFIDLFVAGC